MCTGYKPVLQINKLAAPVAQAYSLCACFSVLCLGLLIHVEAFLARVHKEALAA